MKEKNYNYMLGSCENVPSDYIIDTRKDPDNGCKELYDDEKEAFWGNDDNDIINLEQQFDKKPPFYTIKVKSKEYLFSSDYIGPSVYWARKKGITEEKIRDFLTICRRLGGHILLPRGRSRPEGTETPNQAKGGSNGVYDRFDWMLHLIKIFYSSRNQKEEYLRQANCLLPKAHRQKFNDKFDRIYNSLAFYEDEFYYFGSFEKFCEHFKLIDSFVVKEKNGSYEVKDMTSLFPILPANYNEYIDNLCKAIERRNNILHLEEDNG